MSYLVKNGKIRGEIRIPPSKSHTLRAILFGALGDSESIIHGGLSSPDAAAMVDACSLLGASIVARPDKMIIQGLNGKIHYAEDVINAGNSGIVLRFCSALGALSQQPIVVTGDRSIRTQRPMQQLLHGLSQLGASAVSMRGDGFAPVIIKGPLTNGKATIYGEDSQPVSALLIASSFAKSPVEIFVKNPGEKPWVGLTLHWLDRLGIPYENHNFEYFRLPGNARYSGFEYTVPGDFSSAAFPLAAALVTQSELTLKNLDMRDSQGDKELISIFQKMGAEIEIDEHNNTLHVKAGCQLSGISVDVNHIIDAVTILAVIACFAEGETVLTNAAIAKQKECNRLQCITHELQKMGAYIRETDEGLIIRKSDLKGANLHSHHDHRMAMSLAVAALGAKGETKIDCTECVSKTFPTFVHDFHSLGAPIKEIS